MTSPVSPKTLFGGLSKLSLIPRTCLAVPSRKSAACSRCEPRSSNIYDRIPREFREENLKEGLKQNYESFPQSMYGLTPSQMDMFMTEDNPVTRQARQKLQRKAFHLQEVTLTMEMVPAVTELLVAQFMWLDYDDPSKPIYLYINSSGTQNVEGETVGSETEAYAIADMIAYVKPKVYTINVGMAYGQAAMLLSLGAKGYRGLLLISEAIAYGIADKIIKPEDDAFEK